MPPETPLLPRAESPSKRRGPVPRSRIPAASLFWGVAVGIVVSSLGAIPFEGWVAVACVFLAAFWWGYWKGRTGWSLGTLLCAIICISGAWGELRLGSYQTDGLARIASVNPQPIHLTGSLVDEPVFVGEVIDPDDEAELEQRGRMILQRPILQSDRPRTIMIVRVDEYHTAGERLPIAGLCRLESDGRREDLHVGDRIEIWGRLLKPSPPRNPGDFDFAEYLRIRGIGSIVRCKIPEEIRIVSTNQRWSFRRFLKSEQRESIQLLESLVGEEQGALATAMLLGPRHQLPDDLRRAFSESGAAHLLAISGINVAILAGFVWFWGRLFNLRFGAIQWGMLLIVLAYLGLTDASPPLVRAALLLGFSGFGQISRRAIDPLNGLSLAATIILIWNPADLFDIGAQLSFLAVLGLITFDQFYRLWLSVREPKLIERLEDLLPWWERAGREVGKRVWQLYLYTFAIWVFTQPLVLTRFQLLPSLGFIANVLLTPWVTLVLWLGYFVLLLGKIPFVASSGLLTLPGMLLRWGLEVMESVVRLVSEVPGGHAYLPGPYEWWLWGYYGLLVSVCVIPWRNGRWKWMLRCLGGWCLLGFIVLLIPDFDRTTKCTVLSVGHGGAVLLEFPNGQTVLYDCGAMGDPGRVAQTVQTALLRRGKNRIDLMILSHADADHFNGAVDLLKRIRVRKLGVARSFLRMEIGGIRELTEAAYQAGVPIQVVRAGDEWEIDSKTKLRCLHPVEGREAKSDNANSIVISVETGKRKILLTGDLDREGLADFLRRPRGHYDVLMAPHHGGRTANPPELGAWAAPEYVIVSGGFARFMGRLREVYPNAAAIYWTPMHGGITATIDQRGVLTCEPFREGAFPEAIEGSALRVP